MIDVAIINPIDNENCITIKIFLNKCPLLLMIGAPLNPFAGF